MDFKQETDTVFMINKSFYPQYEEWIEKTKADRERSYNTLAEIYERCSSWARDGDRGRHRDVSGFVGY